MRRLLAILCIAIAIVALIAPVAFVDLPLFSGDPLPTANQRPREVERSRDSGAALIVLNACRHLARSTVPAA